MLTLTESSVETLLASITDYFDSPLPHPFVSFGVSTGRGGAILFHCHCAAFTNDSRHYDRALEYLEQAIADLQPQTYKSHFRSNYYQELAEFGNLLCYLLKHRHLDWDATSLLEKFDEILEHRLQEFLADGNLEMVNGALSLGVYFVRRLPESARARRSVGALLDAIQRLREGTPETGYYWTCHKIIEPRIYTGLSHGSGMILSFLATIHAAGFRVQECEELMHYACRYVLRARLDPAVYLSSFPLWVGRDEPTNNLCLIYGDLGTAFAVLKAASILDNAAYREEAVAIVRRTTQRISPADTFLIDASVWYGVAGAYLLYDRIHELTGEAEFADAARYWLEQIPTRAVHDNEYLGFSSYFFDYDPGAQLGFGFGVAGIGLALLQAQSQGRYRLDEFIWLA